MVIELPNLNFDIVLFILCEGIAGCLQCRMEQLFIESKGTILLLGQLVVAGKLRRRVINISIKNTLYLAFCSDFSTYNKLVIDFRRFACRN